MAQAYEGRHSRRGDARRAHVREDMASLQEDLSRLRSDLSEMAAHQWNALGERVNGGAHYVGEQVRNRPGASLGLAVGAGLLAGIALANMNGNRRRNH